MNEVLRLQVQTMFGWLDLLGSTNTITASKPAAWGDQGTLTATLLDVALDPAETDVLASGRVVRLQALTAAGWGSLFTGKVWSSKVTYPRPDATVAPEKRARIELTVFDAYQRLTSIEEKRSVSTLAELRRLLTTGGVSFKVNGTAEAGPAAVQVVAANDAGTLADQVAITRDTVLGYAWVDGDDVVQVYDEASMPSAVTAQFSDVAGSSESYSTIDASYDSTDVIDEVSVEFLRYKPVSAPDSSESITYGPFRRPGATGTNSKSFTVVGTTEDPAAIEAFAQRVLDRNAVAQVRPVSLSTPVRSVAERGVAVLTQPCSLVSVFYDGGRVDATVRVESVEHTISFSERAPDAIRWTTAYTFGPPEAVARPQRLQVRAPAVLSRIASVEEVADDGAATASMARALAQSVQVVADQAVDPHDTAQRITGQNLEALMLKVAQRAQLNDGVSAPTEAPTVVDHWPTVAVNMYVGRGLVAHHSDPAVWVTATLTQSRAFLRVFPRAGGEQSSIGSTTLVSSAVAGLTYAGGRYWILGAVEDQWKLVGLLATDLTNVITRTVGTGLQYRPAVGVAAGGGSVLVAYVAPGGGGGNQIRVAAYSSSTGQPGEAYVLAQSVQVTDLAWIGQGAFNYGAERIVVQPTDADAMVWSGPLSNPTRLTGAGFPRALGGVVTGMVWDGTRFQTFVGNEVAAHASTRAAGETLTVAASWAGQTSVGGNIETNAGPTRAVAVSAQAQALVSVPTPPEANLGDPGKANRAAVYVSVSGTLRRQGSPLPVGGRTVVLDTISGAGRAAGVTGAFDSSPGDLVPERGTSTAAWMFRLFGSGAGFVSDLSWSAAGAWTMGTRFRDAVLAFVKPAVQTAAAAAAVQQRGTGSNQAIGNNAYAALSLTGADSADGTITRTGTVLLIVTGGLYSLSGFARFAANSAGVRILIIESFTNEAAGAGATLIRDSDSGTNGIDLSVATETYLPAGTKVRLCAYQNSGGSLNVLADPTVQLNVRRIG